MINTDRIRKSISATLDEIEIAHNALKIPVDYFEILDALAIIDRIEARLRSNEPRPQPDPKKFADFAEGPTE